MFAAQQCSNCHRGPVYTTPETYDVGLKDANGLKHFNPPSLRGISQRGAYFHDNRAESLDDVLTVHQHGVTQDLTPQQQADLIAFLQSL